MPASPKTKDSPLLLPRRCKYCRANFIPERRQDKDAKFCCPNHRKAFWRYGGLPFDKMKEQIMKDVRKLIRAEFAAMQNQPVQTGNSMPLRLVVQEEIGRYRLVIDDRASQ